MQASPLAYKTVDNLCIVLVSYYMKIDISLKPLSNNAIWKGRRVKSEAYKEYGIDCSRILPVGKYDKKNKQELFVLYVFHIKNYSASDAANFEKAITDILVARDYLADDRYIKINTCMKEPVDMPIKERIEVYIVPYTKKIKDTLMSLVQ